MPTSTRASHHPGRERRQHRYSPTVGCSEQGCMVMSLRCNPSPATDLKLRAVLLLASVATHLCCAVEHAAIVPDAVIITLRRSHAASESSTQQQMSVT